jgi:hypothetical protein
MRRGTARGMLDFVCRVRRIAEASLSFRLMRPTGGDRVGRDAGQRQEQ